MTKKTRRLELCSKRLLKIFDVTVDITLSVCYHIVVIHKITIIKERGCADDTGRTQTILDRYTVT